MVILNGPSSAGKSSVATELQALWARRGECWVIFGWDDFVPRLPSRWHGGPEAVGDLSHDGISYSLVSEGDEPPRALLVPGRIGRRILRAYHRAVAAIARSGVDVLVEEVLISGEEWEDWREALAGVTTKWVGLRCDEETVVERESARGDRYVGLARGTNRVVHSHVVYDVDVDTTSTSIEEVTALIDTALRRMD